MAEDKVYLLTQDAYDKMKKELDHRTGPVRADIVEKIAKARAEGDLSENGGYQAAKDAQSKNEGRINELTVKLRDSKIITPPPAGEVGNGTLVTLDVAGMKGTYLVGSHDLSVATDETIVSPQSPLGAAIFGHKAGETVGYKAPNGKVLKATIVEATPYHGTEGN